ncbi:Putative uncharacterized protein [Halomonas sp. R57-5]|uniref:hypothetical protein n=1 Tax=Halomonas sp. R57-5 TaxID=1610576 RepID=UPI0005FC8F72|nr:hypothetical protein [Halomonas sp. R57-5]CEP36837.1 Putative uncharacterized protein [Halomonas sp. R57-5]
MSNLFTKDEEFKNTAPIIGFEILQLIRNSEDKRVSIFEVAKVLRKKSNTSARGVYYGMIFLFSLGIVDFNEPYVVVANEDQ